MKFSPAFTGFFGIPLKDHATGFSAAGTTATASSNAANRISARLLQLEIARLQYFLTFLILDKGHDSQVSRVDSVLLLNEAEPSEAIVFQLVLAQIGP